MARAIRPEAKMMQTKHNKIRSKVRKANGTGKPKLRETKRARLISMLKRTKGSDVATLSREFGWQLHTTRAALTGLRKAGFTIERAQSEGRGASSYRITTEPTDASAK